MERLGSLTVKVDDGDGSFTSDFEYLQAHCRVVGRFDEKNSVARFEIFGDEECKRMLESGELNNRLRRGDINIEDLAVFVD